jgi:YebC/PmpR family DNA-binding regulatory protein
MGRAFEYRKERKMKRWSKMSKTFTRIGKEIVIAVKAGGADPESNSKLRAIIQNARVAQMPKENIERAIKRATSKDQEDYKEVIYEGFGPHGIAFLLECATDNTTRTVANVRSYFNKLGGALGTSGSTVFLFEHKSVFKIKKKADTNYEEMELELIDFGMEDFWIDEEEVMVYASFEAFGKIQKYLEEKGQEMLEANFERIPLDTKELTAEQQESVEKLIERFEEDEDVQNVYHNMR